MSNRIGSILLGAAVAALLIFPARAADNDWIKSPSRTFDVKSLRVDNLMGTLIVDVKDGGPTVLEIDGVKWKAGRTSVKAAGGELRIRGAGNGNGNVWDWRSWFDFKHVGNNEVKNLYVHLIVPKGMPVTVNGLAGNAVIGNTEGPLKFEITGNTDSRIGNVASADISLAGSGKVAVGNVSGNLRTQTAGSGDIRAGDICDVHSEIAGSGSVAINHAKCKLDIKIAGSGDFTASGVNGPTHIEIAGSGSVNIAGGEANPLHVGIMGAGDVSFGGTAVNPNIESMGSGSIRLKAYRGNLHSEGNSNLKIGG